MKILYVLPHFYPYVGGGETMFFDVARGMAAKGHEVRVVARNVGDEYLGHKKVEGLDIWYCPWKSAFGHPIPLFKDIEEHIRWCDVVHTSIFTTSPVVSFLAKKHKKPSILTVYEVRGNKWFWSDVVYRAVIYWMVEQFCCRMPFDAYHAISDATKRDYLKFIGRRDVRRVYLANDLGKAAEKSSFSLKEYFNTGRSRVFLYYGRPGRTKGVFVLEEAIKRLKDSGRLPKDVKFCFLLGKEPEEPRKELLTKMRRDGLKGLVRVRPSIAREDLQECIKQADWVVVPSLTEGFGFSALESCQCGRPLIYSDGGSLPEVAFGHCRAFKNRDAKDLADKLLAAAKGLPDAFEDVAEKRFTKETMVGGLEEIYREISGC
ncbi:MAG: glycosyltransferase family 4 protein [Lachnospiraceae bacterium]|nr:glycosyltransferase family 4 protein [Lachnospiraceae bacterium]